MLALLAACKHADRLSATILSCVQQAPAQETLGLTRSAESGIQGHIWNIPKPLCLQCRLMLLLKSGTTV